MGVLKNDVGRPSNKTIRTRVILKFIAIIAFISIGFLMGLQISDSNQKETGKEIAKTDKITLEEIIKKYNTGEFDDKYSLIDMNDDKIDELIYYDQTGDINFNLYIYNGAKNGYSLAKKYEKLHTSHSNVMKTEAEDCLLVYSAHMGTESIDRLYFNDGKIKVTKYEHELSGEEQYLTDGYKDILVWKYASELNKKEVNVKDAVDKFVKNNNMILYEAGKGYDTDALKAMNCTTATRATAKEYYIEIFTFDNDESAKKEFENQKEYQKTAGNDVIQIFDRKILNDKSASDYNMFEIKSLVEDIENANTKSYDYYYGLRINNYYISLFSSTSEDKTDAMVLLKNELNKLLGIN